MKIDTHVHITPPELIRDFEKISEKEAYFSLLSHSPKNKFASAETILAEMECAGMDQSVVFGFSFADMGLCRYVNDYVMEKVKQYPEKFIGFMSVVPNAKDLEQEVERCYKGGLRGVGELFPAGQPFEISEAKDTDHFAALCQHYQLPVIIHTNEPIGHDYAGKTKTSLKEIECFITRYPELKIVLAHFGGGLFVYELMKEIKSAFANVYYDNAAAIFLYEPKIYETFKTLGLMDKLLFGSDFPLLSPMRYEKSLHTSGLNQEDLDKLYFLNAKKLLNK